MCGFCDLLVLGQSIMNFLVFFAVLISVLFFVFAGFLLVTGGANESTRSRAKKIFFNVVIGLLVTLAAWLIVNVIMMTFLDTGTITSPWTLPGCPGNITS